MNDYETANEAREIEALDVFPIEFEKYLTDYNLLKAARKKYLTPQEIAEAETYENNI